jgi:hypothetical protein
MERTREQWLNECAELIWLDILEPKIGSVKPPFRLSVAPLKSRALGQCHKREQSEDGKNEIFITAHCSDSLEILSVLTHELLHAVDNNEHGHKGIWAKNARAVGFLPPLTENHPSPELLEQLKEYPQILGEIPHAALHVKPKSKGRNNNKLKCDACGFQANLSAKWVEKIEENLLHNGELASYCPACDEQALLIERAAD